MKREAFREARGIVRRDGCVEETAFSCQATLWHAYTLCQKAVQFNDIGIASFKAPSALEALHTSEPTSRGLELWTVKSLSLHRKEVRMNATACVLEMQSKFAEEKLVENEAEIISKLYRRASATPSLYAMITGKADEAAVAAAAATGKILDTNDSAQNALHHMIGEANTRGVPVSAKSSYGSDGTKERDVRAVRPYVTSRSRISRVRSPSRSLSPKRRTGAPVPKHSGNAKPVFAGIGTR